MRSGGSKNSHTGRPAGLVAGGLVCMAALLAGGTPARADDAATARLWAVTRAGDGRLHVVRGMRAAIARMDVQLGRTDTQVLSTEDDRPVSELGDPLRPQQWALEQTSFEL